MKRSALALVWGGEGRGGGGGVFKRREAGAGRAEGEAGPVLGRGRSTRSAEVADLQSAAGDRVQDRAVAGSVIGQEPLNANAVGAIERDGALEEGGDGGGFLVVENFDIGQAGAVVDRDMHELPAEIVALGV